MIEFDDLPEFSALQVKAVESSGGFPEIFGEHENTLTIVKPLWRNRANPVESIRHFFACFNRADHQIAVIGAASWTMPGECQLFAVRRPCRPHAGEFHSRSGNADDL